jgi:chemotaxis protein MotB
VRRDLRSRLRGRPAHYTGHDRWLVSYADFITLLFAFFTTMYAISSVDAMKLNEVVSSMQLAFATGSPAPVRSGAGPGTGGIPHRLALPTPPPGAGRSATPSRDAADLAERLTKQLATHVTAGVVGLTQDPRGLVVSIREAGTFATGSAELTPVIRDVLGEVARTLAASPSLVRVEGHTDDVPIHTTQFRSNWELSTARATNVVAFLLDRGVRPERLSAAGYAEYRPTQPNTSPERRALNRRIDIVVLDPAVGRREEPWREP